MARVKAGSGSGAALLLTFKKYSFLCNVFNESYIILALSKQFFSLFEHCDTLSLAFKGACDGERPSVFHRKICSAKNLHFFAFMLYTRNFMTIIFGHQKFSLNEHSNDTQLCMFGTAGTR
jgi:hypothetical protein